jgi:hypothetical protein
MSTFGVDASAWRIDVSQVEDSEYPVREVTLTEPLSGMARSDATLSDFEWTIEVWKDGSITSIEGTLTTTSTIPITLSAPTTVLRSFARRNADPYRVEDVSMAVVGRGARARLRIGRSRTFRVPRTDRVTVRCSGVIASRWYSFPADGDYDLPGAIASHPPARFDFGTDTVFEAERTQWAYLAVVVANPTSRDAFLVPTYAISGRSNLRLSNGKPYRFVVVELAVPISRFVAR